MTQDESLREKDPDLKESAALAGAIQRIIELEDTLSKLQSTANHLAGLLREWRAAGDYPRTDLGERTITALKDFPR